jgi:hypothetical protein
MGIRSYARSHAPAVQQSAVRPHQSGGPQLTVSSAACVWVDCARSSQRESYAGREHHAPLGFPFFVHELLDQRTPH